MTQRGIAGFFRRGSNDAPPSQQPERTPLAGLSNRGPPSKAAAITIGKKRPRAPVETQTDAGQCGGGPAIPHEVHALGAGDTVDAAGKKRRAMEKLGDGETANEAKMK